MVSEPGHPGAASFGVVDLSEGGIFIADDQAFGRDAQLRIGLPIADGRHSVWASGTVVWRGRKDGQDGAGIRLQFEHGQAAEHWKQTVQEWIGLQSVATVASLRQGCARTGSADCA
jgi:Tfp pilus assembly protein PilZ